MMADFENKGGTNEQAPKRGNPNWTKGQSGNPGGRPKEIGHVRELARQHTEEAIRTLAAIMTDKGAKETARVAAAEALLDRGWGKAPQEMKIDSTQTVTVANLEDIIREELAKVHRPKTLEEINREFPLPPPPTGTH